MATETHTPAPPTTIITAFFGFLVSTAVSLAAVVLLAGSRQQLVDALRESNPNNLTEEQIQGSATLGLGFAIGVALVIAVVHLWLAFKLKAGRNWARVVLTVITLLQLVSMVTTQGNTAVGYASCAVALVAVVLSYLPASNAYIADVKRSA